MKQHVTDTHIEVAESTNPDEQIHVEKSFYLLKLTFKGKQTKNGETYTPVALVRYHTYKTEYSPRTFRTAIFKYNKKLKPHISSKYTEAKYKGLTYPLNLFIQDEYEESYKVEVLEELDSAQETFAEYKSYFYRLYDTCDLRINEKMFELEQENKKSEARRKILFYDHYPVFSIKQFTESTGLSKAKILNHAKSEKTPYSIENKIKFY